jgi:hypothetical protein
MYLSVPKHSLLHLEQVHGEVNEMIIIQDIKFEKFKN